MSCKLIVFESWRLCYTAARVLLVTIQGGSTLQGDVDDDGQKPVSMNNTKIEIH